MAFDSVGNFLVADSKAMRILAFSADGEYKGDVSNLVFIFYTSLSVNYNVSKHMFLA